MIVLTNSSCINEFWDYLICLLYVIDDNKYGWLFLIQMCDDVCIATI